MDVYENIAVGLRIKGYSENEIKKEPKRQSVYLMG
jgi:ABC-type sugar transport system ATPase subunit